MFDSARLRFCKSSTPDLKLRAALALQHFHALFDWHGPTSTPSHLLICGNGRMWRKALPPKEETAQHRRCASRGSHMGRTILSTIRTTRATTKSEEATACMHFDASRTCHTHKIARKFRSVGYLQHKWLQHN